MLEMKKWIIAFVFCIALIFVVILQGTYLDIQSKIGMFALIILAMIIIVFRFLWAYRCKTCKKYFAMKNKSETIVKKENIMVKVVNEHKDRYGDLIKTEGQHIPGTRNHYDRLYCCKYCSSEKHIYFTMEKANM